MESTVVASADQVSANLGEEEAVLNVKTGVYFGLDPVGAWIWKQIADPLPVDRLRDALVAEYEVEAARAGRDVLVFLEDLLRHGLIEVLPTDETSSKES
ncbi:MAG: PqqD family peptide modification chaperone [Candidatus Dormibacteraeota bacterium]|nr:PqqD family peptide modification chaperone [Candidatus Dormibacteraeota bacterium]